MGMTVTNAFQKILDKSNCKPNKMRVDKGSEIYNRSVKSCPEKKSVKMHSSTNSEGKSVIDERFIRTLKNKV